MFILAATTGGSATAVLLGILTTISTAILLASGAFGWKRFRQMLSEGRASTLEQLDRIEAQTTKTNGTVAALQADVEALKSDMRVEQTKTKLLTDIYLRLQPDKGE